MDLESFLADWRSDNPLLLVHTSGSTGDPQPLWVEKRRMQASALITCRFLGLHQGDTTLLCLPLDYIAGKMMVVRALTAGLRLLTVEPSSHPLAAVDERLDFAAMVPLQVWNSLQVAQERERLLRIRHLIIGGGPVDPSLADALKDFPGAVWSTYGMTETLSHIALRRLNGPQRSQWYTPLDGVSVSLADDGCLVVSAPAVCSHVLKTRDLALLSHGRFRILGRSDNVVCSGGLKIQIEDVERLLRQHTSRPFIITRCPHRQLGQALVLLYATPDPDYWLHLCRRHLPRYWQPRHYLHVDPLPSTETGKPARRRVEQIAAELISLSA